MKSILVLLSLLMAVPAMAQACDPEHQEQALVEQAKSLKLEISTLENGALKAFNANLAAFMNADPAAIPDMDKVLVVIVQQDGTVGDEGKIAALFAFKDGCFVGRTQMQFLVFKAILERGQAQN